MRFATVLVTTLAFGVVVAAEPPSRQLLTCGRERVHLVDLDAREPDGSPRKLWTWSAAGRTDLPAEYRGLFRSTDECKPFDGGRRVLITSSGGGVALVDRERDRVLFYGRAANAHSADLLPKGRVAVAASRDPREGKGDALVLFEIARPGEELGRTELPSGHGVVWDESRQIVWALADKDIRSYRLADWDSAAPKLTRVGIFELPEDGGHDLYPVPGTPFLAVTTKDRCWLFDRDRQSLAPHPQLGNRSAIKGISQHPVTGQIAFTAAERPNWWTTRIGFLQPAEGLSFGGEQFYKVRWVVP